MVAPAARTYRQTRRLQEPAGVSPNAYIGRADQVLDCRKPPMRMLPSGTVTFLFADIEGSTRVLQQLGNRYVQVLSDYRQLLRHTIEEAEGWEVGDPGDACFAAFPRATDALTAAVAAQRAIADRSWPDGVVLRVRMGLHTGEAQAVGAEYVGLDVHVAARICGAGYGGQILVSDAVRVLIKEHLPPGVSLRDLGQHRLKHLVYPTHIYQVVIDALPATFPPLRSLDIIPNNLPQQVTSFIGREKEMSAVKELLSDAPLVTLTGSGGVGKTRLAIHVAAELLPHYPDGVWLAELAALSDPGLVPKAVALALNVPEHPGRPMLETVVETVRSKSLLLILDNCEHLLTVCGELVETLLRACRNFRILATSREPLRARGEVLFRVPSLSIPDLGALPSAEELIGYESVHLFVDRAALGQIGFRITPRNAAAVAQIAQRLDGIPLAIELAAARIRSLPIGAIAKRLDDRLRLLTGGRGAGLPRQQTLRAALDWSHDLLTDREKILFRRLSVYAGEFPLEAAEEICAGDGLDGRDVLDLLTDLVDKSLVAFSERDGEGRYRLLETISQYGRDKLQDSGEADQMRRRHQDWYLALAERAEPELRGPAQAEWLERLESEHDNFRRALEWCMSSGDKESGLRLACALWWFWYVRGYHREGREWLEKTLDADAPRPLLRARALLGLGHFAARRKDPAAARSAFEEALAISLSLDDVPRIAESLFGLGHAALRAGDFERATSLYNDALGYFESAGDSSQAWVINALGLIAANQGDFARARACYMRGLTHGLGSGHKWIVAYLTANLGVLDFHEGAYESALSHHRNALVIWRDLKARAGLISGLEDIGLATAGLGHAERAARLLGAAEAHAQPLGLSLPIDPVNANIGEYLLRIRAALGEEVAAALLTEGRAMTLDAAVAYALAEPDYGRRGL